jgi:hypothetical protein
VLGALMSINLWLIVSCSIRVALGLFFLDPPADHVLSSIQPVGVWASMLYYIVMGQLAPGRQGPWRIA